ncbi:MAG: 1-(5-phosphoribosyl)-5-[(5-phosphoribosylamino)methylideneamino]imidazole-4-carboxamide isomerase [Deltaproteobacteria bacterium]|nr:1-(5-phosphoribosyl)-5-[(5-phosphoribosylamino)methylideneamino]imidazole-4-carboxamide isomerase [Deltaproteobacteria bacterium]
MKLYPAIDLINGACVRLSQGKFEQSTTYQAAPLEVARAYADAGASYLHVVDLDGAKAGRLAQAPLILDIVRACGLKVQVGGGVRTPADVRLLLDGGVDRVVIGSLASRDPQATMKLFDDFGGSRITVGLDVKIKTEDSVRVAMVATDGWQVTGASTATSVLDRYVGAGLQSVLCTDIGRDGMLAGPSFDWYQELRVRYPALELQASGGVSSLDDLWKLAAMGMGAAIIGKALYENRFTLAQALKESLRW